ncbi:hypothetical protein F0344_21365 [Streptomyces finlayi]|uniref:Uncharacterized protein n=1 Tax=Streptomyces finlayi TaxID=67296 RepID=A0A7G7BNB1_9ACTN|nr:hypothetical protein [Streptomyces finlayi]QNE76826.1 hypothetical protein F0344_21365 [Streptomyces finlayi]
MSTAPAHGPRDSKPQQQQPHEQQPQESEPTSALVFDDPLDRQSSDDTDRGWGERTPSGGSAADLARFLDEKPPHHV